jgi:hypothetical protein
MEVSMDNKYGLGSARVATAHHETHHKAEGEQLICRFCYSIELMLCPTLNDHYCKECGAYQSDIPPGYSTGHSHDY